MQSTPWYRYYADLVAGINCRAADPYPGGAAGAQATNARNASACAIRANVTGTAVVRPPWGAGAGTDDVTLQLVAGMPPVELDFDEVIAGGSATGVTIFWPRV